MPNHLTPEELSKELGIERDEVIRVCYEESIPIYQGKIDKYPLSGAPAGGRRTGAADTLRGLARTGRRALLPRRRLLGR